VKVDEAVKNVGSDEIKAELVFEEKKNYLAWLELYNT
jgi:hypothetical protein